MLQLGEKIPTNIKLQNDKGEEVTLNDYLNDYLVIYFYPEAMTPGCTTEACQFRDANDDIKDLGATIVGVSADSVKKLQKFRVKESLNFELLSDKNKDLINAFGVWGEKTMFGRTFMGIRRSTFIANRDGVIIKTWEKVTAEGHAEEVLEYLKSVRN